MEDRPFRIIGRYCESFEEFENIICGYLEKGYCILGEPHYRPGDTKGTKQYHYCYLIKETFILQVKKALVNGENV